MQRPAWIPAETDNATATWGLSTGQDLLGAYALFTTTYVRSLHPGASGNRKAEALE